jgi:hypothetical protein
LYGNKKKLPERITSEGRIVDEIIDK